MGCVAEVAEPCVLLHHWPVGPALCCRLWALSHHSDSLCTYPHVLLHPQHIITIQGWGQLTALEHLPNTLLYAVALQCVEKRLTVLVYKSGRTLIHPDVHCKMEEITMLLRTTFFSALIVQSQIGGGQWSHPFKDFY